MEIGDYITTYTGISFYPFNPRKEDIFTQDIAHALSLLCRANGHFSHFYSVAQHSLNCAKEAEKRGYSNRVQLACLLHDASEAYISDVTRPIKKELVDYLEVEKEIQKLIYSVYDLTDLTEDEKQFVDAIDDDMLDYEMEILFNANYSYKGNLMEAYDLQFTSMDKVEDHFINLVKTLEIKRT